MMIHRSRAGFRTAKAFVRVAVSEDTACSGPKHGSDQLDHDRYDLSGPCSNGPKFFAMPGILVVVCGKIFAEHLTRNRILVRVSHEAHCPGRDETCAILMARPRKYPEEFRA